MELHLAGSIHLLRQDFYPLPKPFTVAFESSDVLVLEALVDSLSQHEIGELIMQSGMYLDGSTSADVLPEKTYRRAMNLGGDFGLPEGQLSLLHPWILAVTLEGMILAESGYDESLGMEMVVTREYHHLEQRELEGLVFQFNLLSNLRIKDQILFLETVLDERESLGDTADSLVEAWKSGDDETIGDLLKAPTPAEEALNRRIISDRNREMVEKLIAMVDGQIGTWSVLVGTAHYLGFQGLPILLKDSGWEVYRVYSDGCLHPLDN